MNLDKLSAAELRELEKLLELQAKDGLDNISLYEWQERFITATANYRQCLLMCANRVGKTYTGTYLDAIHLTGRYPTWWEGHRYDHPPLIWCLGYSGEKCRDLLQQSIFGPYSQGIFGGGLISPDQVVDATGGAIPRLANSVKVKWTGPNGKTGTSQVQFKSYSQGQHALMGDNVDWYHIDEEPKDHTIWPQVLTRSMGGDNGQGGRGILTFTPENGKTELVAKFMDDRAAGQYLQTATWDDAPHLSEQVKAEILESYPAYQRDMRSKGVPLMGAGLIFEHDEKNIKCDPFEIPAHWYLINGMDFGWDHPQAHIQIAWDMGSDTFYIIHAFKKSKIQPYEAWHVVSPWSDDVPVAWPHDGLQTEKGSARQQKDYYEEAGFEMLDEHATWEEGGNGVEAGLMELNNLMKTGRFKVFSHLKEVFEEIRQYHRVSRANGRSDIVKLDDDLVDAIRYAYMMRRHAIQKNDLDAVEYEDEHDYHSDTNAMGY